jgi:hypothetical protein
MTIRKRQGHALVMMALLATCTAACKEKNAADSGAAGKPKPMMAASDSGSGSEANSVPDISDSRLYKFAGTMDIQNHYASTVMVTLGNPEGEADCSGVLLNSRLALTAAHCVCVPQKAIASDGPHGTAFDSSSCSKRASITTVLYGATLSKNYKEETTEKRYSIHEGSVRPHPEFQLLIDGKGSVASERANLATILLDEPVEGSIPAAIVPETEAQAGEPLLMVGYASKGEDEVGGIYGVRYFRKDKVTQAPSPGSDRVVYEQQGPSIYNGYPGGPCYREADGRHWLMGIASIGSPKELSCTSSYLFRDWLVAEIQAASRLSSNPSLDSGVRR